MFDPYHKWLGIPKDQRPPTHYQILGVAPDEQDADVIEEAAIRQTTHVRTYQMGPQAADCTRLLNEIAQAKRTLLDPDRRKQYDAALPKPAARPAEALTALPPAPPKASAFAKLGGDDDPVARPAPRRGGKRGDLQLAKPQSLVLPLAIGGGVAALAVVALVVFLATRGGPPEVPRDKPPEHKQVVQNPNDLGKKVKPPPKDKDGAGKQPLNPDVKVKTVKDPPNKEPPVGVDENPGEWNVGNTIVMAVGTRDPNLVLLGGVEFQLFDLGKRQTVRTFGKWQGGDTKASIVLSPEGGRFFGAHMGDPVIYCWDLNTGQELGKLTGHTKRIGDMALTPGGKFLVSISDDQTVRLWDTTTFKEVSHLGTHDSWIGGLAISPDGRRAVTGGNRETRLWDLQEHRLLRVEQSRAVSSLAYTPDGKNVVTAGQYGHLITLDANTLKPSTTRETMGCFGKLMFTRDGTHLLSMRMGNMLQVFEWPRFRRAHTLEPHAQSVSSLSLTPDGNFLITVGRGPKPGYQVRKIPVAELFGASDRPPEKVVEGKEVRQFKGHTGPVTSLAVSADGATLYSGSLDGTVCLWGVDGGKSDLSLTAKLPVRRLALSPDAKLLLVSSDTESQVMDPVKRTVRKLPWPSVPGPFWTEQGSVFSMSGPNYHLSDLDNKKHFTGAVSPPASALFGSPSGKWLVAINDKDARLCTLRPGKMQTMRIFSGGGPPCAAISADDNLVAIAERDGTIRVVDQVKKRELIIMVGRSKSPVLSLAFCPGNRLLSGGNDKTMRLWDIDGGRELGQFPGHEGSVLSVACTPDGRHAFSGSEGGLIRQWELPAAK